MDWTFGLLFFVFAVLIMVAPMYRQSKTFRKNLFYANDVSSVGVVSSIEVFVVDDKELGHVVGLAFDSADEVLRMSMAREDAVHLADMLEADARSATAANESSGLKALG